VTTKVVLWDFDETLVLVVRDRPVPLVEAAALVLSSS
jgi:hypothetical protein